MGYGDFSRYNNGESDTPALDELIDTGLTFSQHYAASPVCAPARAALLTGRYPHRTGVIDTLEVRGFERLALRETTMADELQRRGYSTGLVGKWHTGDIGDAYHPCRRGFDEFVGFRGGWQDYWDWRLERAGRTVRGDGRYLTHVLTHEAIDFVRRHAETPFFLHLAYNAPHFPFQAPTDSVQRFQTDGRSLRVASIYAMLSEMDSGVGSLLHVLDELGLTEDTLVLFTSDNGPQLDGEGERSALRFNCGLAGQKQHVYEGGIRLPLIARWPGRVPSGESCDAMIHAIDWYPTVMDIVGEPSMGGLPVDGASQAGPLVGSTQSQQADRFWQWTRYAPMAESNSAMRSGNWKFVMPAIGETLNLTPADQWLDERIKTHPGEFPEIWSGPMPDRSNLPVQEPQLFNLASDPGETTNLASSYPERVSEMNCALQEWFTVVETERKSIY